MREEALSAHYASIIGWDRARELIEEMARGPEISCLFWPTIMAYLRVATHPAVFARHLPHGDAVANVEQLLARAHVKTPGEQPAFWRTYRAVANDALPTGNLVPAAHIVAFMHENGVRTIWTRDRDLRRFKGITTRDPFI